MCTPTSFKDEEVREIFRPTAVLPENMSEDEVIAFDYGQQFLDCEDCVPYAMLYVENVWFRPEQNNYANVVLINNLQKRYFVQL